jgi:hypothetical protein
MNEELRDLKIELQDLRRELSVMSKMIKKRSMSEGVLMDEILTSKEFQVKANKTRRQMYHILDKYPYLKNKKPGIGILINYYKYLREINKLN